jgi:hypothetical protein
MAQKNDAKHISPFTVKATVPRANSGRLNVPLQKRKEDAKQEIYLNRI